MSATHGVDCRFTHGHCYRVDCDDKHTCVALDACTKAKEAIEGLVTQQVMPDYWWQVPYADIRAALTRMDEK